MIQEIIDHNIESRAISSDIRELLQLWTNSELNGRAPYALFAPKENRKLTDDLFVIRPVENDDFIYAHFGKNVAHERGLDHTGMLLSEIKPQKLSQDLHDMQVRLLATGKPLLLLQRTDQDSQVLMWERLVLPCIDHDGRDVIVICNKPREFRIDLLHAVIEATPDGVLMTQLIRDSDGHIVDAQIEHINHRAAAICMMKPEELIGSNVRDIFPHMRESETWQMHVDIVHRQKPAEVELLIESNGKPVWLRHHLSPVGERVLMAISIITKKKMIEVERMKHQKELEVANSALAHEIARRKALENELRAIASIDPLTGLVNRRALTEAAGKAMAQAERYGHGIAVIAADLDHFKSINSRFGHGGGDEILKSISRIFSYGLREDIDIVGRMGGEEFLAILPNTSLEGAVTITERLRRQFETFSVPYQGKILHFTASFGVCAWNGRESLDEVSRRADAALMQAKASGRNIVVVDTGDSHRVTLRRMSEETTQPSLPLVASEPITPAVQPQSPIARKIRLKAPKKTS